MNHNAPDAPVVTEPFVCERCGCEDDRPDLAEMRYGAIWCGACCNCEDVGEAGYEQDERGNLR